MFPKPQGLFTYAVRGMYRQTMLTPSNPSIENHVLYLLYGNPLPYTVIRGRFEPPATSQQAIIHILLPPLSYPQALLAILASDNLKGSRGCSLSIWLTRSQSRPWFLLFSTGFRIVGITSGARLVFLVVIPDF